ncbi:MAG TPA: PA domain-containing protein [Pyrinomonadaceae bacterium]|nr:PA domain-containing protein [Pyrinomonadaceae bacterium]
MQELIGKQLCARLFALLLCLVVGSLASSTVFGANVVILNGDTGTTGFNDTTPVSPVGGNSGTTLGQQRLIALQHAASIWGATLISGPTITIRVTWQPLTCTTTSAALAQAGNNSNIHRDFSGAIPGFWYGNALANALSNTDRNGTAHEINAQFNINIGTTGCFDSAHWYYGLDTNHGSGGVNLVTVALHEFGHGLGFQTFTNSSNGIQISGTPSIYDRFLMNNSTGKLWPEMTNAERAESAVNTTHLVWNGPRVQADAASVLKTPLLKVNSPPAIAGNYEIGTADFGAPLSSPGVTANVIQATDPVEGPGNTSTDGCSPFNNAGAISGKIALIDRGICTFVSKVLNAQNAGAIGVIIVNNVDAATPPGLGGSDPSITIPTVSITKPNGDLIKAQLASGVNATLVLDGSVPSGVDSAGRVRMFSPEPFEGGSSVSHWDTTSFPNLLMEPNISGDLTHSVMAPFDLTTSLFTDLGWLTNVSTPPTILTEEGTNRAVALESVTQLRGPFRVQGLHNFSADRHTRVMLFTTNLGLGAGDDLSILSVNVQGNLLPIESVGTLPGINQASYIVVRLVDQLPAGGLPVIVTLRGVPSNTATIEIVP